MRTDEHELLADPLVALPREVAERLALNVAERFRHSYHQCGDGA